MADPKDVVDRLLRLADLVTRGLLERDEFDRLKAELLSQPTDARAGQRPPSPPPPDQLEQVANELLVTLNRSPDSAIPAALTNRRWAHLVKSPRNASSFVRRVELGDDTTTVIMTRRDHNQQWEITARRYAQGQIPAPLPTQHRAGPPPT